MTSQYARNHADIKQGKQFNLQVTKDGTPVQGQVPRTYQIYAGQGNETIALDGSDYFVIQNTLTAGALVISALDNYNLYGRVVNIVFTQTTANNVRFNYNGQIHVPGQATTSNNIIWTSGKRNIVATIDFYDLNNCFVSEQTGNSAGGAKAKTLAFAIAPHPTNVLNLVDQSPGPQPNILFNPGDNINSENTTTLVPTLNKDGFVTSLVVVDPGSYSIDFYGFINGNLNNAVRWEIRVNEILKGFTVTTQGLTGIGSSLGWVHTLNAGDIIMIKSYNVQGPVGTISGGTSFSNNQAFLRIVQF